MRLQVSQFLVQVGNVEPLGEDFVLSVSEDEPGQAADAEPFLDGIEIIRDGDRGDRDLL